MGLTGRPGPVVSDLIPLSIPIRTPGLHLEFSLLIYVGEIKSRVRRYRSCSILYF